MDPYWFGFDCLGIGIEYDRPGDIAGISAQIRKPRIIYKQPLAGMGFKRGQRRIKR